jgi:hypothetical protein
MQNMLLWDDNIKVDVTQIICENVNWTQVMCSCEHYNETSGDIKKS